jgi:hypothetical protein
LQSLISISIISLSLSLVGVPPKKSKNQDTRSEEVANSSTITVNSPPPDGEHDPPPAGEHPQATSTQLEDHGQQNTHPNEAPNLSPIRETDFAEVVNDQFDNPDSPEAITVDANDEASYPPGANLPPPDDDDDISLDDIVIESLPTEDATNDSNNADANNEIPDNQGQANNADANNEIPDNQGQANNDGPRNNRSAQGNPSASRNRTRDRASEAFERNEANARRQARGISSSIGTLVYTRGSREQHYAAELHEIRKSNAYLDRELRLSLRDSLEERCNRDNEAIAYETKINQLDAESALFRRNASLLALRHQTLQNMDQESRLGITPENRRHYMTSLSADQRAFFETPLLDIDAFQREQRERNERSEAEREQERRNRRQERDQRRQEDLEATNERIRQYVDVSRENYTRLYQHLDDERQLRREFSRQRNNNNNTRQDNENDDP